MQSDELRPPLGPGQARLSGRRGRLAAITILEDMEDAILTTRHSSVQVHELDKSQCLFSYDVRQLQY